MREPWRSFLYFLLVVSLPLAFWYALMPHRRRLKQDSSDNNAIKADG